jgi:putative ABC transport system permease protein
MIMFSLLLRKIRKNFWIVLCLLLGIILAISIVSAIPIYSRGILQRVLLKDLKELENTKLQTPNSSVKRPGYGETELSLKYIRARAQAMLEASKKPIPYAGAYTVTKELKAEEQNQVIDIYRSIDTHVSSMIKEMPLSSIDNTMIFSTDALNLLDVTPSRKSENQVMGFIKSIEDIESHIEINVGHMASSKKTDRGEYEVIVSQNAVKSLNLVLNNTYDVWGDGLDVDKKVRVKVVGIYSFRDEKSLFNYGASLEEVMSFVMNKDAFFTDFLLKDQASLRKLYWYYALDYNQISIANAKEILSLLEKHNSEISRFKDATVKLASGEILKNYVKKGKQLQSTLWIFQIPVLLIILFYISMLSNLIIEREKDEIATLKSRGASRANILSIYFAESLIVCLFGILLGPPLGLYICKVIGASSGFMQFVNRSPLIVTLTLEEYVYSLIACTLFIAAIMYPVISVSKTSIVLRKQTKSRASSPIWMKYYADAIFLIISIYGLYNYRQRQGIFKKLEVSATDIPIDPVLYFIIIALTLSGGLIFLRIYPYLVRLLLRIGQKLWSAPIYASMINVGRTREKNQVLMLFLILTISIGIFNMKAATTINTQMETKLHYLNGTDIRLKPNWEPTPSGIGFQEPSIEPYRNLENIESVTKVFTTRSCIIDHFYQKSSKPTYLMGIVTNEFGKTAWFNPSFMNIHWYSYLNILSKDPRALILSRSLEKRYSLKIGDTLRFKWKDGDGLFVEGYIYGFVDYWPTYYPNTPGVEGLIVANLYYLQKSAPKEPYEIWLKESPVSDGSSVYSYVKYNDVSLQYLEDVNTQIALQKNEPMLQGTNGALTLCFLSSIFITTAGFLIFWGLSIKNRVLQFGILRSMGLSLKSIILMLINEQFLVSGSAIAIGLFIGSISSTLSLPLINIVSNPIDQYIPKTYVSFTSSYIQISLIFIIMILICFILLAYLVSRIKIDQAIKLGED